MNKPIFYLTLTLFIILTVFFFIGQFTRGQTTSLATPATSTTLWKYQCIDTMKTSRDRAREWQKRENLYEHIDMELTAIKEMGANCIAIATPYDDEFFPYLNQWIEAARRKKLSVWFRGNWSGWEGWFGYPKFTDIATHHQKTFEFITKHPEIFQDDDLFTPVPEPENGIIGNPGDSEQKRSEFTDFLIGSYNSCQKAFREINKKVECGLFSTNGDIAKNVFKKEIIEKLGRKIAIDHFVRKPESLGEDILFLNQKYDANILISEFGAPIPNINGWMSEDKQANFIEALLFQLYRHKDKIYALNYWTLSDSSTALLNKDGTTRRVVAVMKNYYIPGIVSGTVTNPLGEKLSDISLRTSDGINSAITDTVGNYTLIIPASTNNIIVAGDNYKSTTKELTVGRGDKITLNFVLEPEKMDVFYRIRLKLRNLSKKSISLPVKKHIF